MGELTGAFAVQDLEVYTKCLEQVGQDDATYRIDGVGADTELTGLDSLDVNQTEVEHRLDMLLVHGVVLDHTTQFLHGSVVEVFLLGNSQYLSTVGCSQELTLAVEQLQRVPLCGVVRGGDDDTTVGLVPAYCQLGGWCGSQTNINHFVAHADKRATDNVAYHGTRDAAITAYNDFLSVDKRGVCRCEFHDVQGVERVTRMSADSTADT